ncbi:hypothetical protein GQX73_g7437 [Xylaria multiplex]|uniref:Uncharacterized protein n=1 Tax=Xylaria multiplex TaxID=323545 RepID=A0A7C8MQB8_9PEZI|nr:hypothetical protein GQX73_g7437 [Xylaria multiplex]
MRSTTSSCLLGAFRSLKIAHTPTTRPSIIPSAAAASRTIAGPQNVRLFSASASMAGNWLEPSLDRKKKMMKGRARVATGGSVKGTTVMWGDFGLRMTDHHRRISAQQLKMAEDTIKARLRGQKYRLYKRVCCNVGVYISGNEMRMGKGKGGFDHWAARVAVNQIVLELRGMIHEQVVRDAFRLAGNKLPGQWEFVKKGEAPIVGITKLDGITLEELKRPRRKISADTLQPIPPSLDLKAFNVSSKTFNLSLSMTSSAFIYDVPLSNITQDDLRSLIQSKQLWLLPRGVCRLDVHVYLGECDISRQERDGFLKFIADTVCQSSVWSQLGLSIELLDVQYHEEEDMIPNLYFGVEQPDMSSALLSPPHVHTAQFKGLECILRFTSSDHLGSSSRMEEAPGSESPSSPMVSPTGSSHGHLMFDTIDPVELWETAANLVEVAFCITLGTRRRIRGYSVFDPEKAPSLLDLAPTIWNSRYQRARRRSVVSHTKNFPVISNIFASSLKGQSPELRRKGAELLQGASAEANNIPNQDSARHLEPSIQRMLWDLLQGTLKPTIGTTNITRNAILPKTQVDSQDPEIDRTMVDEGFVEQYCQLNEYHYPYETLSTPAHPEDHYRYQSNASYNSDLDLSQQQSSGATFVSQDNQTLEAPGPQFEMEPFYSAADTPSDRLLEPNSQHFQSDLPNFMRDHLMSDYMNEDDNIYDYEYDEYDCIDPAG